jgi:single-strand DNA-binding protein
MNLNKAIIIGRLTRDPEMRTTPTGQQVTSFGMATNRTWNDASGNRQEKTEFHNIVAWGKLAEICGQYLTKGQEIYIEGRIETRNWEGQDGIRRTRTEIIAENMQMGQRPRGEGGFVPSAGESQAASEESSEEAPPATEEERSPNDLKNKEEIKVEDIPF